MIALTGASGQLGRLTLRMLRERVDAAQVVALSRTPEAITGLGVPTRLADFDDPDGLVTAFDGVERLLLVSTNVFGDRRVQQEASAVRAAVEAGVGHVIYTSIAGAGDPAHPAAVAADHRATETALAESGLAYTVLGNSMYTQLIPMGLDVMLASGMLLDNSGYGATSYVTREDCAAVAAAVLAHGGYEGERLDVTGPRAITQAEVAALITEFSGVRVCYRPITDAQTVADLVAHGMAEPAARLFATIGKSTRDGYTCVVTDVVERITGHGATSVAEFLAATCAARFGDEKPPSDAIWFDLALRELRGLGGAWNPTRPRRRPQARSAVTATAGPRSEARHRGATIDRDRKPQCRCQGGERECGCWPASTRDLFQIH
jgi:NAD(P)H dehydrogenase (quinone)